MVEFLTIVLAILVIAGLGYAARLYTQKQHKSPSSNTIIKQQDSEKKQHKAPKVDITARNRKQSASESSANSSHHPLIHRHLRGHTDEITSICWSHTSGYILSTSVDQTLRVWLLHESDAGTGIVPYIQVKCQGLDHATAATWSPDDSTIVLAMAETKSDQEKHRADDNARVSGI